MTLLCDLHVGLSELLLVIAIISKSSVVGFMLLNITSFDLWFQLSFSLCRNHSFFSLLSLNPCYWLVIYILFLLLTVLFAPVLQSYFQYLYIVLLRVSSICFGCHQFNLRDIMMVYITGVGGLFVCLSVCMYRYVFMYACIEFFIMSFMIGIRILDGWKSKFHIFIY